MRQCDFSIIRYVPDPVKEEFMNIGLIFIDGDSGAVRFTSDWDRIRNFDKSADVEMLKALASDLRQRLFGKYHEEALSDLQDRCSNALQFTEPKACLCDDAVRELESLVSLYL